MAFRVRPIFVKGRIFLEFSELSELVRPIFVKDRIFFKCLAELPSFAQKIFRPAEDCSMCRDVQQVDRISSVDPAIFEERYWLVQFT